MPFARQLLDTTADGESEPHMTAIDTDRETLGPIENPEEETTLTKKGDGKKSQEQPASTDDGQALRSSDDDDPFDNMPV